MQDATDASPEKLAAAGPTWRRHGLRLVLLATVALFFFGPLLLHPTQLLYTPNSDLLSLHVPRKQLLVRQWHGSGELPLWNPYEFCGAPLIHDIQVAAFYPPHAILYMVFEQHVPAVLCWLVVAHVILAGWCMYAYAASEGQAPDAALVAAIGYMLAGKWLLHLLWVGHYILIGLAWFPLMLLFMSRAIRRRSVFDATVAGVLFALMILGTHPQWTLYAGLFAAVWTIVPALGLKKGSGTFCRNGPEGASHKRFPTPFSGLFSGLAVWLASGVWVVVVGVALTAVQLWPTYESARYSTRGVAGVEPVGPDDEQNAQQGNPLVIRSLASCIKLVGPGVMNPHSATIMPEFRGNVGLLWLLAAAAAPLLGGRTERWQAAITVVFALLAVVGLDLLMTMMGVNLFRLPSRMIVIVGLPVAMLAGRTTDILLDRRSGEAAVGRKHLWVALFVLLFTIVAVLVDYLVMSQQNPGYRLHPYWLVTVMSLSVFTFLLLGSFRPSAPWWRIVWVFVLLADAVALSWVYVEVRPGDEIYGPAASVEYLVENLRDYERVIDFDVDTLNHRTSPLGSIQPQLHEIHTMRGYNPLGVHRYREFIELISDRPIPFLVGFSGISIANKSLLDMAGVRYLLQPSAREHAPPQRTPIDNDPRWKEVFTDPAPRVYVFSGWGMREGYSSYTVYRNEKRPLPRAFVVGHAASPPNHQELARVMKTNDFRKTVLLDFEDSYDVEARRQDFARHSNLDVPAPAYRPAVIRSHQPNRVTIEANGDAPGWLVLSDVWFPGWQCTVDGRSVPVQRANYAFRAVPVDAGPHEVVFTYHPETYAQGTAISRLSLGIVGLILAAAAIWEWRTRRKKLDC